MKRIAYTLCLIMVFGLVSKAQDIIPFSLRNFLATYTDSLNGFFLQEEFANNFKAGDYFLNYDDTLFWPDNYKLEDRFFRNRLGPMKAYNQFTRFKNLSSISYHYSQNRIGSLDLIKSKSARYYDKYRIKLTEDHIFNSTDFFGGTDSIVKVANFYDIVSWFDPSSADNSYVYRINRIQDSQSGSRWMPKSLEVNMNYLLPSFSKKIPELSGSSGYSTELNAGWLLGGKNYLNYSFLSGVGFSTFNFSVENGSYQLSDSRLVDRDNYPFTLKANLHNLYQAYSFNTIHIPIQMELTKYSPNGRFSAAIRGGLSVHFPLNSKLSNSDGEVTYAGKYKFSFYGDSILLENLDSYNFKTFTWQNISSSAPKLNSVFVSADIGTELSWYLGKRWAAGLNLGYRASLSPFYSNKNQSPAYNITDTGTGNLTFGPAINSFLAVNESKRLNSLRFGVGIRYILDKPVVPYGKIGYNANEIRKLIKSRLILNTGSFSQNSREKTIYFTLKDSLTSKSTIGQKLNYRFVGPSPKFYKQGRIIPSSVKGNRITFLVPASNTGARLFIEEPYGYDITLDKSLEAGTGGMYGEIKVIRSEKIWKPEDDGRNLEIVCRKLNPMQLYLINYKYNLDDLGRHRDSILSRIGRESRIELAQGADVLVYVVSDEPEAFLIKDVSEIEATLEKLDIKLRNTNDVFSDLGGLKNYILKQDINPRRKISFTLFTSNEFIDEGKKSAEDLSGTLNIDNEYVTYRTFLHSYGQVKSPDFENSFNYLKKTGNIYE